MRKYKRYIVLPVVILLACLYVFVHDTFVLNLREVFSYSTDNDFYDIYVEDSGETILLTDRELSLISVMCYSDNVIQKRLTSPVFYNVRNNPYICRLLSEKHLKPEKHFFRYSDGRFDEYFGIYDNPLWDSDSFYADNTGIVIAKKTPSVYYELKEKIRKVRTLPDTEILENQGEFLYDVKLGKSEIYSEKDGVFISFISDEYINSSFVEITKDIFPEKQDIYVVKNSNFISMIFVSGDEVITYSSISSGKRFSSDPVRNQIGPGRKIIRVKDKKVFLFNVNGNNIDILSSADCGISFGKVYSLVSQVECIDADISETKLGLLCSENMRDYIFVYDINDLSEPETCYGNLFPSSLKDIIVTGNSVFFQRQHSDRDFSVMKMSFK